MRLTDYFHTLSAHHRRRVTFLDSDGRGVISEWADTAEEALAKVLERIWLVFREPDWTPIFVEWRGKRYCVYLTPDGWQVNPMETQGAISLVRVVNIGGKRLSRAEAERAARRHLATSWWEPGDDGSDILLPDDEEGQREFERNARFQTAFRQARAQGMDFAAAHEYALNARDFRQEGIKQTENHL